MTHVISYLGSPLVQFLPRRRARVVRRVRDMVSRESLNLDCRAEKLLTATTRMVAVQQGSLLLLCPEWNVVALAQPSIPFGLERTELPLASPVIHWMQDQDTTVAKWSELIVLPQFQGMSLPGRNLFERLDAEVLIPLRVNGGLTGIMVLGPKKSGNSFRREELGLLAAIARSTAQSIENARKYSIEQANVAELRAISEMKSDYILSISHQLKTPISAVKASAEMLAEPQAESPELRQRLVNSIVRGVDSLNRLVTELTEYGKMQSSTLELDKVESSLSLIVNDACALLQPLADDKKLRLTVEAPHTLPRIMVDPHRVQQVVSNLLSNAIKFTPAGGEVSVRVSRNSDGLMTEVKDNGPGIPEDRQGLVFQAFQGTPDTTKGSAGSGLGLAIAKALTELHGGTIWVESQEGKGSSFFFTLPLGP